MFAGRVVIGWRSKLLPEQEKWDSWIICRWVIQSVLYKSVLFIYTLQKELQETHTEDCTVLTDTCLNLCLSQEPYRSLPVAWEAAECMWSFKHTSDLALSSLGTDKVADIFLVFLNSVSWTFVSYLHILIWSGLQMGICCVFLSDINLMDLY